MRALSVLKRQLALRDRLIAEGKINHEFVFFKNDGGPIRSLKHVYSRWCFVIDRLGIRYHDPYNARHACVSWHLMIGRNHFPVPQSMAADAIPIRNGQKIGIRRFISPHCNQRDIAAEYTGSSVVTVIARSAGAVPVIV
jgi:hypothetical protein